TPPAPVEKLCGLMADVPEPLHHDALAGEAGREAVSLGELRVRERVANAEVDAAPGRLGAALDAALVDRLPRDAADRIDLAGMELRVGVRDPGHLARPAPVVGRGDVNARPDEVLLDELRGVAARDPLELGERDLARVDPDRALGAAEGNVHDRALVGHE